MKKLIYLIVLALILGLVLTGCLLSNVGQVPSSEQSGISYLTKAGTKADPEVIDLLAGQTNKVGEVKVWNDDTNLCVKYQLSVDAIAEGLFLTETHLAVAISIDDIPQTNKGNPIPGHFFYSDDHGPVTEYTYDIPLNGWGSETVLYIAAHAVVERTETGTFMPELTWQRSLEPDDTMFFPGYGAAWTPTEAFTIPLNETQTVWDNGSYYDSGVTDSREYASWKYAFTEPDGGSYNGSSDLRRFQATFTIPEGYTVTGGSLYAPHFTDGIPINDNVYIFVNGEDNLLFWGGTRVFTGEIPGSFLGVTGLLAIPGTTEPKETDGWYIPGTIPEVTEFIPGENVIDIFTEENERWGGMGKLVLELDYKYTETAWANGKRFTDRGNWATYITYNSETWWTRSGEFISTRWLPDGQWKYDVSFTKSFNGDLSHGKIILTDPEGIEIVADVQDIKSNYQYWAKWGRVPNYAAVGTATYEIYDGNFMFLIADEYIWMALSQNDFSPNWGAGGVWQTGRAYDIHSELGTYW